MINSEKELNRFIKQCIDADLDVDQTEEAFVVKFASEFMSDPEFKEGFIQFIKEANLSPEFVEKYVNTNAIGYSLLNVANDFISQK